jgi:cytochrome c
MRRLLAQWFGLTSLALVCGAVQAQGDAAAGQKNFVLCSGCHGITKENRPTGPYLLGVYGRKAGAANGFGYSKAMKDSGITWDEKSLDEYLADPAKRVPGTSMPVQMSNEKERADIIAYLRTLK